MAIKTPAELLQDISTYITNKVGKIRRSEHGAVERDIVESFDSLITAEKNARINADSLIMFNVGEAITELEEDLTASIGNKVSGPAISVNNSIPVFDGITGKLLKETQFKIEGYEINGGLNGSIILNNSSLTNRTLSIQHGSYNDENAIKIGRNLATQHYISFANDTAGGSSNWISFKIWNNKDQRNTVLTLQSLFGSQFGIATITGKLQVNNGDFITQGGNVGIGISNPSDKLEIAGKVKIEKGSALSDGEISLDIRNGENAIVGGADLNATTLTNNAQKYFRILGRPFANASIPTTFLSGACNDSSTYNLNIGGGTSRGNAVTTVSIYTASNSTTQTGTERMRINPSGQVGIATTTPITNSRLDISDGNLTLTLGADTASTTRTNVANKVARIGIAHYTNSQPPMAFVVCDAQSSLNEIKLGGGTGLMNAATQITFFTAATTTTTTGTERMRIDSAGNVGIGNNNPTEKLHVTGNIRSTSDIYANNLIVSGKINMVTEKHIGDVETLHTTVEINPNTLNEEVTLFTIPAGYRGFLLQPSIVPSACSIGINNYSTATASTACVLTFYWTPIDVGSEQSSNETLNTVASIAGKSLSPYIKPNTTIRAKVTTAGVGYTNKVILQANLILQKI